MKLGQLVMSVHQFKHANYSSKWRLDFTIDLSYIRVHFSISYSRIMLMQLCTKFHYSKMYQQAKFHVFVHKMHNHTAIQLDDVH